jgi:hypothetical protein
MNAGDAIIFCLLLYSAHSIWAVALDGRISDELERKRPWLSGGRYYPRIFMEELKVKVMRKKVKPPR